MASQAQGNSDKKRVKVYELRENDWFDRGTGFCTGQVINDEPKIYVEAEEKPEMMLLETRIIKDDSYQKQQDTLIVWTEPNGIDMALSFQEAEGCASIWEFITTIQSQLLPPDDGLSDDALDGIQTVFALNQPTLGNLDDIEQTIRHASTSQAGREAMTRFLIKEQYLKELIQLVTEAEDLESLGDLHRLCNIMKALILMNDNNVMEYLVTDDIILGVVGALEYDPDFPTHKANHRAYLSKASRFKEVVEIKDENIKRKIRQTWRLQYMKDVVLARILDDPTFGVLNSLIFFNHVEIITHINQNQIFLRELFAIFGNEKEEEKRQEQAVQFIQQCCAIAKSLQMVPRGQLLNNFINHGLFNVITFAVRYHVPSIRTTGIEILVALLDHDPMMMRGYMLKSVHEKRVPLTDTLIELLHTECDLGVKDQLANAIKILLDPTPPQPEPMQRQGEGGYMTKMNRQSQMTPTQATAEQFAQEHFDRSCRKLFSPLKDLEQRQSMNMNYQETTLYTYLVEILTFFLRSQSVRSRNFVSSEALPARITQLLRADQKHLALTAMKFFRTCLTLQDQFYMDQVMACDALQGVLEILTESLPRDNLLNSACLELFEHVAKDSIKPVVLYLGHNFKSRIQDIAYVETFRRILIKFDQFTHEHEIPDRILFSNDDESPSMNKDNRTNTWIGLIESDAIEQDYFNTSDDELDLIPVDTPGDSPSPDTSKKPGKKRGMKNNSTNGAVQRSLVPYLDEDDDDLALETGDMIVENQQKMQAKKEQENGIQSKSKQLQPSPEIKESPLERLSEKRRKREEDNDDELDKIARDHKRRNSSSSISSITSGKSLRRKQSGVLRSKESPERERGRNRSSKSDDDRDLPGDLKSAGNISIKITNNKPKHHGSSNSNSPRGSPGPTKDRTERLKNREKDKEKEKGKEKT